MPKVLSYDVRFTRRRYGSSQWYCWAEVSMNGEWQDLGDPWPARSWPRGDLEKAIRYLEDLNRPANMFEIHPHNP
jgi:hypothetical protein